MKFQQILPDIFLWIDTCNVYVLRHGDRALLIDLGDGSVLENLQHIGINHIDWLLFTHHHREQCQGIEKLKSWNVKIACSGAERTFFENPSSFRKMNPSLGDAYTVYGSSYVRPPIQPIKIDHTFGSMDTFQWNKKEFWCINTRGNSPGSMTYMLKNGDNWIAFSGDVMLDGAKMHTWFDTEWDYGFSIGIYALFNGVCLIESFDPKLMLPSHGDIIRDPVPQLREYKRKIRELEKHYIRGYEVNSFGYDAQDNISKPTSVPYIWQVSPHLFKFKGPEFWANFAMILSDSGHALFVDCGVGRPLLEKSIELMKERMGLKKIDAVIITHMHGDHCSDIPFIKEKYGVEVWTLDSMVDQFENPKQYNYVAPINTYGIGIESIKIDRAFKDGESFQWEGYKFTVDWLPGQTEFGLCLRGIIDNRLVAFTGDNIFGDPRDITQNGHEAVVAHNSGILEEGYIYTADYLQKLNPDLLIGGHSWVMDNPKGLIERFKSSVLSLRDAFIALSTEEDYRYMFDPFWINAKPYRIALKPNESTEIELKIRNFLNHELFHHIEIHTPKDIKTDPLVIECSIKGETSQCSKVNFQAMPDAEKGLYMIAFDVTLGNKRYGEWFDMIINIE
jgi:glyoxylase-like metal-dependent hydrolase (beta-lactamase superfamily II)